MRQRRLITTSAAEVLHGPDVTLGRLVASASNARNGLAAHVDVMAMRLKVFTWPFVPHLLQAEVDYAKAWTIPRAFVLGAAAGFTNVCANPGVSLVHFVVVLGLLVGAIFGLCPTFERRKALTLPTQLIDAGHAVRVEVSRFLELG